MIGVLRLKDPQNPGTQPDRSNTCLSAYDSKKPNYALSNFETNGGKGYTFFDAGLTPPRTVTFPTSEHYLHFQQLSGPGKEAMLKTNFATASAGEVLAGKRDPSSPYFMGPHNLDQKYVNADGTFNGAAWDNDIPAIQMQINATKYQQSSAFRASIDEAIRLGKGFNDGGGAATIIEDTSSLPLRRNANSPQTTERKWGTGPMGDGKNILGNSQTAFANMVLQGKFASRNTTITPSLSDFQTDVVGTLYKEAETQYTNGVQVALKNVRLAAGSQNKPGQPDTSDLGTNLVENYDNASKLLLNKPSTRITTTPVATTPLPTKTNNSVNLPKARSSPKQGRAPNNLDKLDKIKESLGNDWTCKPDSNQPHSPVVVTHTSGEEFTVHPNRFETASSNPDTIKAMLKAFKESYPGQEPKITLSSDSDAKMKAAWKEAFSDVFPDKEFNKVVSYVAAQAPAQPPPAPARTDEPEPVTPRQRI